MEALPSFPSLALSGSDVDEEPEEVSLLGSLDPGDTLPPAIEADGPASPVLEKFKKRHAKTPSSASLEHWLGSPNERSEEERNCLVVAEEGSDGGEDVDAVATTPEAPCVSGTPQPAAAAVRGSQPR